MASIRENETKRGTSTWTVLYRRGKTQTGLTFDRRRDAIRFQALIHALGAERAEAEHHAQMAGGITVDDLAASYFAWRAPDVTPRTLKDNRRDYDNWIRPTLGHRRADAIDERDVQQWVDGMRGRLDPKTIGDRHGLLHAIYRYGVARTRRLVDHDPCGETDLPKRSRKPPKGVTVAEYRALHEAARTIDPDAADLIEFLYLTGWRWSEATALAVRDVDDWAGEGVWVSVSRVHRRDEHNRVTIAEDEAKSEDSKRRTQVPATLAATIRRRLVGRGPDDLVFTNAHGVRWYANNFGPRVWRPAVELAGLERQPTPHWLRHGHVAALNRTGRVSMADLARRLGHASVETTFKTYGRLIQDVSADALEALDVLVHSPTVAGEVVSGESGPQRPRTLGPGDSRDEA